MKITFLGTGCAKRIPRIGCKCKNCLRYIRKASSILITDKGMKILIDTPAETQQSLIENGVDKLDAIFFTHHHRDHIFGFEIVEDLQKTVDVYVRQEDYTRLKYIYSYLPEEKVKYKILDKDDRVAVGDITIEPIEVIHDGSANGYLITCDNYKVVYIPDIKDIHKQQLDMLKNCDVLILGLVKEIETVTHAGLEKIESILSASTPKRAILTHIGHDLNTEDIKHELAYDGMEIEVNA